MDTNKVKCENCEQFHEDGFEYCPHCGQKTVDDLTLGVLFYNTISNYFSFDARFLKSFIPLMFKPGILAQRFIEGKRLLYLHPAQMYLFISVIFFFIISFSTRDLVQKANEINKKVVESDVLEQITDEKGMMLDSIKSKEVLDRIKNEKTLAQLETIDSIIKQDDSSKKTSGGYNFSKKKIDSLVASGADDDTIYKELGMPEDAGFLKRRLFKSVLKVFKGGGAGSMAQAFFDSIPLAMFFLLPIFALILKIFYFFRGKYVHHLVFSFYFFSFLFTVMSIIFGVNRFIIDIPDGIDWLIMFGTFIYFFLALKRFYRQNWILTFIKSGFVSFIFLLMVIPMATGILFAFSFLFQ